MNQNINALQKYFLCLFLFLFLPNVFADNPRDPYQHFFNQTWGNFDEELQNARDSNKKAILIFFEIDGCPFCHYMKVNVLNQPEVQAYFREHFLNFAMDIEGDVEITDFQGVAMTEKHFSSKVNRVRATPVFAVFDLQGKRISRFIGRTSGVEEFMLFGKYIVEKEFEKMSFLKYKRLMRKKAQRS